MILTQQMKKLRVIRGQTWGLPPCILTPAHTLHSSRHAGPLQKTRDRGGVSVPVHQLPSQDGYQSLGCLEAAGTEQT